MIYVIIAKHAKFPYSSIESQLLPCTPACGYKSHAPAVYLYPTFTAPFQSEVHLEFSRAFTVGLFGEIVDVFRPLAILAEGLHRGYLRGLCMRLCPITHCSSQKA